jgi:hypothetical protein
MTLWARMMCVRIADGVVRCSGANKAVDLQQDFSSIIGLYSITFYLYLGSALLSKNSGTVMKDAYYFRPHF